MYIPTYEELEALGMSKEEYIADAERRLHEDIVRVKEYRGKIRNHIQQVYNLERLTQLNMRRMSYYYQVKYDTQKVNETIVSIGNGWNIASTNQDAAHIQHFTLAFLCSLCMPKVKRPFLTGSPMEQRGRLKTLKWVVVEPNELTRYMRQRAYYCRLADLLPDNSESECTDGEAVNDLETRLVRIESKLDQLLSAKPSKPKGKDNES